MRRYAPLPLIALVLLAACGPVSQATAERRCLERARLAAAPRGEVGIGLDSNGNTHSKFEVTITSDYLGGRDPAAVYDACVYQQSGQPPSQPLYSRTDWKG